MEQYSSLDLAIKRLKPAHLQSCLREINLDELVRALPYLSKASIRKLRKNMSPRAFRLLVDDANLLKTETCNACLVKINEFINSDWYKNSLSLVKFPVK